MIDEPVSQSLSSQKHPRGDVPSRSGLFNHKIMVLAMEIYIIYCKERESDFGLFISKLKTFLKNG